MSIITQGRIKFISSQNPVQKDVLLLSMAITSSVTRQNTTSNPVRCGYCYTPQSRMVPGHSYYVNSFHYIPFYYRCDLVGLWLEGTKKTVMKVFNIIDE